MLSKLNAVLDPKSSNKSNNNHNHNQSPSFVPNFVFPNVGTTNNENDKNINNQPPQFNFDDINKHRTTAPSINNNWSSQNDAIIPTPIKQKSTKSRQQDILAKYDLEIHQN